MSRTNEFLQVPGVRGGAVDDGHEGWINVMSYKLIHRNSGPADLDKLVVELHADEPSVARLMKANNSRERFSSVVLEHVTDRSILRASIQDAWVSSFVPPIDKPYYHVLHFASRSALQSEEKERFGKPKPSDAPGPVGPADSRVAPPTNGLKDAVLHVRVLDEKGAERVPKGNDTVKVIGSSTGVTSAPYESANGFVFPLTGGPGSLSVIVRYAGFEDVRQDFLFNAPAKAPMLKPFWPGNNDNPAGRGRRDGYLLACMKLPRTAGGHDDKRSPKVFNLAVTLHRTQLCVAVIGTDYWEGPTSSNPKKKSLDFDKYALTYMKHLTAAGVLNLSSSIDVLDCQRGRIERWDQAHGVGWARHLVLETHTPAPAWPHVSDFLAWEKALRDNPAEAKKYIGAPSIYRYLSALGTRLPGAVVDFSVFGHGWYGGAVLFNTRSWADGRKERFGGDLDMRPDQDFVAPNSAAWAHMPKAFATDGTIHIWGCVNREPYGRMTRFLLNNPSQTARLKDGAAELRRSDVVILLRHAIEDETYMARIAKFTGRRTFGGVPGFGADIEEYGKIQTVPARLRNAIIGRMMYVPVVAHEPRLRRLFESAELGSHRFNEFGYMLYKP